MSFDDEHWRHGYAGGANPRGPQRPDRPSHRHRFPVSSSTSTPSTTQSSTASSQFSLSDAALTRSTTSTAAGSSTTHGVRFDIDSLYDIGSCWVLDDSRCAVRHRLALRHRQLLGPRALAVTNSASTSSATPSRGRGRAKPERWRPRTAGHRTARRLQHRHREPGRCADEPSLRNGRALARARTRFAGRSGRGAAQKTQQLLRFPAHRLRSLDSLPISGRLQDLSLYSVRVGVQDRCWPGLTPSSSILAGGGRDHRPSGGRCRWTTEGIPRFSLWDKSTTTTATASSPFQVGAMREPAYNKNNHDDTMSPRTESLVTT